MLRSIRGQGLIFNGTISLEGDNDSLPVNFEIANSRFVIRTLDGSVLGDWHRTDIDVRRQGRSFVIRAEGEELVLFAKDAKGFARAIQYDHTSDSDEDALGQSQSHSNPDAINWPVIGAVIGLIAGVAVAAAVMVNLGSSGEESATLAVPTPSSGAIADPCAAYGEQMGPILIAVAEMGLHEAQALAAESENVEAMALSPNLRASFAGAWDLLGGEVAGIQLDYRLLPDYGLASQDAFGEALDAYALQFRSWATALKEPNSDVSLGLFQTALLRKDEAGSKMELSIALFKRECES